MESFSSFYSMKELRKLGFQLIGRDVQVSRKASIYSPEKIQIHDHVRIDDFCILSGRIVIGSYVHIAAYAALYGGSAGICISDYANLSSRVSIYAVSDDYSGEGMTNPMIPDVYKKLTEKEVFIGRHVLIGASSVVMPGVRMLEGSAFGSFSFVNQNSDGWSIYAGIPVKKIKERNKNILMLEQKFQESQKEEQFMESENSRGGGINGCYNEMPDKASYQIMLLENTGLRVMVKGFEWRLFYDGRVGA